MLKIAIITGAFPHPRFPQGGAFVLNVAKGLSEAGASVHVLALVSLTHLYLKKKKQKFTLDIPKSVAVRYVNYISFSNYKLLGISTSEFGHKLAKLRLAPSLSKAIRDSQSVDILYGKFLMGGGRIAAEFSKKYNIPAVADLGESKLLDKLSHKEISLAEKVVAKLSGAICVSPRLAREVQQLGMDPSRILMLPNGVDTNKFKPLNKENSRIKLGIALDKKIIIFVGQFIDRKGPNRLLDAVEKLPEGYFCIFLGEGTIKLKSDRIIFQGRVPHQDLNLWLNCADVFCLPTLAEGSCNAIEEARAVGLPIVTSNISDITDFSSSRFYTLIDPLNIDDIAKGILKVLNSGFKQTESDPPLTLQERSQKIYDWLGTITARSQAPDDASI